MPDNSEDVRMRWLIHVQRFVKFDGFSLNDWPSSDNFSNWFHCYSEKVLTKFTKNIFIQVTTWNRWRAMVEISVTWHCKRNMEKYLSTFFNICFRKNSQTNECFGLSRPPLLLRSVPRIEMSLNFFLSLRKSSTSEKLKSLHLCPFNLIGSQTFIYGCSSSCSMCHSLGRNFMRNTRYITNIQS